MTWTADRLRELRKAHDLTQAEFAVLMGVGKFTVVNWERGGSIPPMACKLLDRIEVELKAQKQSVAELQIA